MRTELRYHLETDFPPLIACFIREQIETRLGRGELVSVRGSTVEAQTSVARWTCDMPVKIDRKKVAGSVEAQLILVEVIRFDAGEVQKWLYTSQPTPVPSDSFGEG